jgi:hypothetical protein
MVIGNSISVVEGIEGFFILKQKKAFITIKLKNRKFRYLKVVNLKG